MNTISESASPWRATTELAMVPSVQPEAGSPPPGEVDDDKFEPWGNDGFTFRDFLDIINPLQHIPVIGTIYRQLTGDELDAGSRVLGGTLFFGPVGTVVSVANVLVEEGTGKDVGEHVVAFFEDRKPDPEAPGREEVADIGARSVASAQLAGLASSPESGLESGLAPSGAVDPVTAWAMSEVAYRKSAADKAHWAPVGDTAAVSREDAGPPGSPAATTISALDAAAARPTAPATEAAANPVTVWAALTAVEAPMATMAATTATTTARTNQAAGAIRDARAGATLFQAAATGLDRPQTVNQRADNQRAGTEKADTEKAAPGAIGRYGGWFTETMLTALGKYDDGAALAGVQQRAGLDITR